MTEAEELELLELESEEAKAKAPPPVVAPKEAPSGAEAFGRGAMQGASLGFGDELWGAARALGDSLPESMGGDNRKGGFLDLLKDRYKTNRDEVRTNNKRAEDAHGGLYLTGNLAGGLATAPLLGGAGAGTTLLRAAGAGAALGAAQGLGSSESNTVAGDIGNTALGGALGAGAGALGYGGGKLLGLLGRKSGNKVQAIQEAADALGDKDAGAFTGSKMSAAGRTAQEAYKGPLELRKAGKIALLEPDVRAGAERLLSEYDAKAAAGILEKEAAKEAAAQEFKDAMATQADRAKKFAADKLSGAEFKRQLGARAMRYGVPAVGGLAYQALTGDSSPTGLLKGAGLGALAGAGSRPMMHSMLRLARQPVVQQRLWQALGGLGRLGRAATPGLESMFATEATRLEPGTAALIEALAKSKGQRQPDAALASGD